MVPGDAAPHGWEGMVAEMKGSWAHCIHSKEAEKGEWWCFAYVVLFIQSGTLAKEWYYLYSGWVFLF